MEVSKFREQIDSLGYSQSRLKRDLYGVHESAFMKIPQYLRDDEQVEAAAELVSLYIAGKARPYRWNNFALLTNKRIFCVCITVIGNVETYTFKYSEISGITKNSAGNIHLSMRSSDPVGILLRPPCDEEFLRKIENRILD